MLGNGIPHFAGFRGGANIWRARHGLCFACTFTRGACCDRRIAYGTFFFTAAARALLAISLALPMTGQTQTTTQVRFQTTMGNFVVELYPAKAPKTVQNFVQYAQDKHFDGTIFHRIIPGFMIQGGDPLGQGTGGPGFRFEDEPHPELVFDRPYLLAMANSGPNTNGSQFFITVAATDWLNFKHTIFGEVADQASRDVVDVIAGVPTGQMDRPVSDVVIESVTVSRD